MAMINKIIFFTGSIVRKREYEIYGIDTLLENGFEIEIWDFTAFLHPQYYREIEKEVAIEWDKYRRFMSWEEARLAISKITPNCLIVCTLWYELKCYAVYKTISKNKLLYCVIQNIVFPPTHNKKPSTIINQLKRATFYKIKNAIFRSLPLSFIGIRPANLLLAGGASSINIKLPINKKTKVLWLHNHDYEFYLNIRSNLTQKNSNTAVFIDQYLPFHPDFIREKSQQIATDEYFTTINRFFEIVERELGVQIVIAAHPISHYNESQDYFCGRSIVKGKTIELVRNSKFILTHASTSLNFAILFHKPIMFITSRKINYVLRNLPDTFASAFGKKAIDMDYQGQINLENELSINEKTYLNYKHLYIKKNDSEDMPFWQGFADYVKKQEHPNERDKQD